MNRTARIFCTLTAAAFLAAAFSPARAGEKASWKIGTVAPRNVGYAVRYEKSLLPAITGAVDGTLDLKVYWGGVMGDDVQHLQKMRIGQLQAAALSGQGTFLLAPDVSVLGLPFLFRDYGEVDYVKPLLTPAFDRVAAREGFHLLAWLDQGFDQLYSADQPVAGLRDFSRTTFLTYFPAVEGRFLEELGARVVPTGIVETPSNIRSGLARAIVGPSVWVVGSQLYSVFLYVNPMKIRYVPAFVVVTDQGWNQLSPGHRKALLDHRSRWTEDFDRGTRADSDRCVEAMVKYGMKKVESTPEELEAMQERLAGFDDRLAGKAYSREILDTVRGLLAEYRKKHSPAPKEDNRT